MMILPLREHKRVVVRPAVDHGDHRPALAEPAPGLLGKTEIFVCSFLLLLSDKRYRKKIYAHEKIQAEECHFDF